MIWKWNSLNYKLFKKWIFSSNRIIFIVIKLYLGFPEKFEIMNFIRWSYYCTKPGSCVLKLSSFVVVASFVPIPIFSRFQHISLCLYILYQINVSPRSFKYARVIWKFISWHGTMRHRTISILFNLLSTYITKYFPFVDRNLWHTQLVKVVYLLLLRVLE